MPLESGSSPAVISKNISELTHHGSRPRSHDQIVAIALSNADKHPGRAFGGGIGGMHAPSLAVHPMHMSPSMESPWTERAAAHSMTAAPHLGGIGGHMHMDDGGISMSQASPWTERADARAIVDQPHYGGIIQGNAGGRTDRIPLQVGSGDHVMVADYLSGLGQGSSSAGASLFMKALRTGPYGTPLPHAVHGHGPPSPPRTPQPASGVPTTGLAHGGEAHPKTSILAAGEEFICPRDDWVGRDPQDGKLYWHRGVVSIGRDALHAEGKHRAANDPRLAEERGHKELDRSMANVRDFNIKWLRSAPKPKA